MKIVSAEEYARLKPRDRRVVPTGDLTDADVERIAKAEVPVEHAHLDEDLKDWRP